MIAGLARLEPPQHDASLIKRWLHGLRSREPIFRNMIAALKKMGAGRLTRGEVRYHSKIVGKINRVINYTQRLVRHYGFKRCDDV